MAVRLQYRLISTFQTKIALTANIKERFTFGSDVQIFHTQYGVGVKFIIE